MCDIKEFKLHRKCTNPLDPIAVFITWKNGKQLGLCEKCWSKIADSDLEWGEEEIPKDFMMDLEKGRGLEKIEKEEEILEEEKIFENYVQFGKNVLVRKDIAEELKKKKEN